LVILAKGVQKWSKRAPFIVRLKGKGGWGIRLGGEGPNHTVMFYETYRRSPCEVCLLFLLCPADTTRTNRQRRMIYNIDENCSCLFSLLSSLSASRRVLTWIKKWLRWRRLAKLEATTRSPWGPPGVPQGPPPGGPQKRRKNGDFWVFFFTNPE